MTINYDHLLLWKLWHTAVHVCETVSKNVYLHFVLVNSHPTFVTAMISYHYLVLLLQTMFQLILEIVIMLHFQEHLKEDIYAPVHFPVEVGGFQLVVKAACRCTCIVQTKVNDICIAVSKALDLHVNI